MQCFGLGVRVWSAVFVAGAVNHERWTCGSFRVFGGVACESSVVEFVCGSASFMERCEP